MSRLDRFTERAARSLANRLSRRSFLGGKLVFKHSFLPHFTHYASPITILIP